MKSSLLAVQAQLRELELRNSFTAVTIDINTLETSAVERYSECPKHITVVRHADLADDSEFHCIPMPFMGPLRQGLNPFQRDFIVPAQTVLMVTDKKYGLFSIISVSETKDGPEYALVISVRSRLGFLIPLDDVVVEVTEARPSLATKRSQADTLPAGLTPEPVFEAVPELVSV